MSENACCVWRVFALNDSLCVFHVCQVHGWLVADIVSANIDEEDSPVCFASWCVMYTMSHMLTGVMVLTTKVLFATAAPNVTRK